MVDPRAIFTKGGAQVGDVLILTKPLGTGILTTAGKNGLLRDDEMRPALEWMMTLNRAASHAARAVGIRAATDITGFAVTGHAYEMAAASNTQFVLELNKLPVLERAFEMAQRGSMPGGTARNRDYLRDKVLLPEGLTDEWDAVLFDPQTSGGLLLAAAPDKLDALKKELDARGAAHWVVGYVAVGTGIYVR